MKGVNKMKDEIKGISCEVKNCIYHDKSDCCNAGHIVVGEHHAEKCEDTVCKTFESCEEC